MIVHFWGVRGSLPTPLTPYQIQSKIMAVVQRITPEDLINDETKNKFISSLPSWILGTTGGNTPCIEVRTEDSELIFDAGTGIRCLGKSSTLPEDKHFHLFFSHFHWDHIQGLPFFDCAYNPEAILDFYSPVKDFEKFLKAQMNQPYYPVPFEAFTKNISFNNIECGQTLEIGKAQINCVKMNHPGTSYSYSVSENGKKIVYATDVELKSKDFTSSENSEIYEISSKVFKDADCIILDSQYTVEEAYRKENWGHSAFCYAVDFAIHWNIKKLFLFHHEPTYDDKKLNSILQAARWYAQYIQHSDIQIYIAKEDMEFEL